MRALSIRAPWWWMILHNGKDIENRDWPTSVRGTVLVHASKWWNADEVYGDWTDMRARIPWQEGPAVTLSEMRDMGGALVGTVEIVDCVTQSDSPWFFGDYGFVLRNPAPLKHRIPLRGALGFFYVPDSLVAPALGEQRQRA